MEPDLLVLLLSLVFVSSSDHITQRIAVILPKNSSYLFSVKRSVPAIQLGINQVYKQTILNKDEVKFEINYRDSNCDAVEAPLAAFDFITDKNVDVFIGPCCDFSLAPVARYSKPWNIPVVTPGGFATDFAQKYTGIAEYKMLTRVGPNFESLAYSIFKIVHQHHWTKVKILYDSHGMDSVSLKFCSLAVKATIDTLDAKIIFNEYRNMDPTKLRELNSSFSAEYLLTKQIALEFGVIIMCASADAVREIMLEAQRLGFTNGEYIFFNIDLFASKTRLSRPWYKQNDSTENNESAKQAFQSLMMITLKKPDDEKYREFSDQVKTQAAKDFPGFDYGEDEVNSFVGAFHDAVLLYAIALNETLASGGNITNGTAITQKMWGRKFNGITGEVTIDNKGDREADYSLLNFNPETDTFDVAANYLGSTKEFSIRRQIYWVGGSPPLDTPKCGFDKSGCPEREVFPAWGGVTVGFSAVLIILSVIGFFVYRRYKLESELNSMTWRIRSEDIIFGSRHGKASSTETSYRLSLLKIPRPSRTSAYSGGAGMLTRRDSRMSFMSRLSTDSMGVLDHGILNKNQVFTKTAYYKGSIMALKPLSVRTITVNRAFLMEIKSMKDIQNDHIVRFVGVCLDSHHEYIITEYCQKGSLQDILENDQIQLDAMFKTSLLQDIIRGMEYLHSSVIRYHGNLKSTNCVVDSRFVLKITDFGLNTLRSYAYRMESEDDCEYQQCKRKLWTAPELLDSEQLPTVTSYQKGDVYSFAIICQEVIYRQGVFSLEETEHIDPEEIIKTLRSERTFRPKLYSTDCDVPEEAAFIKRCWTVEPADRPDFPSIKAQYRRFAKHAQLKGGNLVDNLLSRMELYANNLESLVEERTADYLEEKKKAEDLLYMMLPKSIASILIKGESVTAEWFDQVTIYFSDICGFTALSAESTPMQVVALLNDLYTVFDTIIENFDVYKVETIGDAYMVVSGLPNKNGQDHAKEIARMSLKLLEAVKTFKIRHIPNKQLKLRIGIHTGPVCAGVVGLKMPRYCLFGDTVNTASRMESNGLPLRIHVSPDTEKILRTFGTFELELRGQVEMKGKGTVTTYWLNGDKSQDIIINPPIQQNNRLKPIFRRRPSIVPSIPEEDTEDKRRSAPLLNNLCQLPSNNLKTSTLTNNNSLPLLKNNENGLIKRGKSPTPHGKAEFRANGDRANGKDLELAEYERIPLVNRNLEVV